MHEGQSKRIKLAQTALLVVDLQERLVPVIHDRQTVVRRAGRLIEGCQGLGLPVLATEQYRKGLGETVPEIARLLGDIPRHEKMLFSACVEPVMRRLGELERSTVILVGIEAHVCVLQSCLDLFDAGYMPVVARDACGSRRVEDRSAAFARMDQLGVMPTTAESALFEMTREAGTEAFGAVRRVIKAEG